MSKKSIKSAAAARRKEEIEMVTAIGSQLNQMVSTVCNAAVESRRIDMEGLESKDKAEVLKAEGTTLVALVESNNQALSAMWGSMAPMLGAFLSQMAQTEATRAQAQNTEAEAALLNAQTRAEEAAIKEANSETEKVKAEAARMRAEVELEASRARSRERARAAAKAPVNGAVIDAIEVNANDVW